MEIVLTIRARLIEIREKIGDPEKVERGKGRTNSQAKEEPKTKDKTQR